MNSPEGAEETISEIDFRALVRMLWKMKLLFVFCCLLVAGLVFGYVFLVDKKYEATVVLLPHKDDAGGGSLASLAAKFGGVASLVGMSGITGAESTESYEILNSRQFVRNYIVENDLMPVLFYKKWDSDSGRWRQDLEKEPSLNDAVEFFCERVYSLSKDDATGVVSVRMSWNDPELSATWANEFAARINLIMREQAILRANTNINYLQQELQKNSILGLEKSLYTLIEAEINKKMVANYRKEYAFRVIDPAFASDIDEYVWPNLKILVALGFAIACFGFLFLVVVRSVFFM